MEINIDGQIYIITNWKDFSKQLLEKLGLMIEGEIVKQINKEKAVDTGFYKRHNHSKVVNGELIIWNDAPYSMVLEYGSPGTKKGVTDPFGESSAGPNPLRKMPLTKVGENFELVESLKGWASRHGFKGKQAAFLLARKIQEEGMTPRAPYRKVLYNPQKMSQLINKL